MLPDPAAERRANARVHPDLLPKLAAAPKRALLAYLALSSFTNGKPECWPSTRTLAERAGVPRATIQRGLADLEAMDLVERKRRVADEGDATSTFYRLVTPESRMDQGDSQGVAQLGWATPPAQSGPGGPPRVGHGGPPLDGPPLEGVQGRRDSSLRSESLSPQKRNDQWDGLEAVFGYRPKAPSECRLWGKLAKELAAAGATRASIEEAATLYQAQMPDVEMTPTALAKHYERLLAGRRQTGRAQIEDAETRRAREQRFLEFYGGRAETNAGPVDGRDRPAGQRAEGDEGEEGREGHRLAAAALMRGVQR